MKAAISLGYVDERAALRAIADEVGLQYVDLRETSGFKTGLKLPSSNFGDVEQSLLCLQDLGNAHRLEIPRFDPELLEGQVRNAPRRPRLVHAERILGDGHCFHSPVDGVNRPISPIPESTYQIFSWLSIARRRM